MFDRPDGTTNAYFPYSRITIHFSLIMEVPMAKRYRVLFNKDKCKGCELCVSFCPKKILAMDEGVNNKGYHPAGITDESACVGCRSCATMCPDCCISIYELEEGETA